MRLLFTSAPGVGHAYPLVSSAWAARAAGHEVTFAVYGITDQLAAAGLPVLDSAPGVPPYQQFHSFFERYPELRAPMERNTGEAPGKLFGHVSEPAVERTVAFAKHWRPDVVVHETAEGAGPLAAACLGVPSVVHAISADSTGRAYPRAVAEALAERYAEYGAQVREPAACIDLMPPRLLADPDPGWQFRYLPYNGGAVLPEWLEEDPGRPRILVTLGSVVPSVSGVSGLGQVVRAAHEVDAEFVFALGDADLGELGPLPDNVRQVPWVPLSRVLDSCSLAIHHGGAGTTCTTLAAGVPQLVLPHGMDHHVNANLVTRAGSGAVLEQDQLGQITGQRVRELLGDESLRGAARDFAKELAGLRPLGELPALLETL
ncbi:nucleotide disphospho-sugar-binding domain-containing protein [Sciscionella sediminilitoris]|uniref:nucleotide disphospho-sugar-binding domain-containing protein n=1 Tax=Sciscionella sediminilitoris TaxID=1445613 RepID=UPI0004DEE254|nr:nucleotide disphospho-sugar-binding domain-containing protein [Sciscionella sp. SE31]